MVNMAMLPMSENNKCVITHCVAAPCCRERLQSPGEARQTSTTFRLELLANQYVRRPAAVSLQDKATVMRNKQTYLKKVQTQLNSLLLEGMFEGICWIGLVFMNIPLTKI